MKTLIVIPARLASTRLPRKLLLAEDGMSVISHVVRQCANSRVADDIVIACPNEDEPEIYVSILVGKKPLPARWPKVVHTADHPNGTSRAAQVALFADQICERPDGWWEAYCVVQADYPEISPALIDQVITELERHEDWDCATACTTPISRDDYSNRNRVKCQWKDGIALEFHRQPIDYGLFQQRTGLHIGIYAYRRHALLRYASAGPCQREQDESLEQLRALRIGLKMGVVLTSESPAGIDTREDYEKFIERQKAAVVQ